MGFFLKGRHPIAPVGGSARAYPAQPHLEVVVNERADLLEQLLEREAAAAHHALSFVVRFLRRRVKRERLEGVFVCFETPGFGGRGESICAEFAGKGLCARVFSIAARRPV